MKRSLLLMAWVASVLFPAEEPRLHPMGDLDSAIPHTTSKRFMVTCWSGPELYWD